VGRGQDRVKESPQANTNITKRTNGCTMLQTTLVFRIGTVTETAAQTLKTGNAERQDVKDPKVTKKHQYTKGQYTWVAKTESSFAQRVARH